MTISVVCEVQVVAVNGEIQTEPLFIQVCSHSCSDLVILKTDKQEVTYSGHDLLAAIHNAMNTVSEGK